MDVMDFDLAAEAYSGLVGKEIQPGDLREACSRVSQIERRFNLREGLRPEEDTLPERFLEKPIPDGPAQGTTLNIRRLVDDY
jgi:aldehyde:ferredoxin oxidoreductase